MKKKSKTIMVFGVFDLLHPGHEFFLKTAADKGRLVAIVARDKAVSALKARKPDHNEKKRLKAVQSISEVGRAVLGDIQQGTYAAIKKYKPALICLGYDQRALDRDLRARMRGGELPKIRILKIPPHHPRKFKTSLMRRVAKH